MKTGMSVKTTPYCDAHLTGAGESEYSSQNGEPNEDTRRAEGKRRGKGGKTEVGRRSRLKRCPLYTHTRALFPPACPSGSLPVDASHHLSSLRLLDFPSPPPTLPPSCPHASHCLSAFFALSFNLPCPLPLLLICLSPSLLARFHTPLLRSLMGSTRCKIAGRPATTVLAFSRREGRRLSRRTTRTETKLPAVSAARASSSAASGRAGGVGWGGGLDRYRTCRTSIRPGGSWARSRHAVRG
jgi:hypothetical protein